ncbi:MAG: hypothetical protein R3B47_14580 [Bacteroidia bacterium]
MRYYFLPFLLTMCLISQAQHHGLPRLFMTPDSLDFGIGFNALEEVGDEFVAFGIMASKNPLRTGIFAKFDSVGRILDSAFYVNVGTFPYTSFIHSMSLEKQSDSTVYFASFVQRYHGQGSGLISNGSVFSLINARNLDTLWFHYYRSTTDPPMYLSDIAVLPEGHLAGLLTDGQLGEIVIFNKEGQIIHQLDLGKSARGRFTSFYYSDSTFWIGGVRTFNNVTNRQQNPIVQKVGWDGTLLREFTSFDTLLRQKIRGINLIDSSVLIYGVDYFGQWQKPPFNYPLNAAQAALESVDLTNNSFQSIPIDTLTPSLQIKNIKLNKNGDMFYVGQTKITYHDKPGKIRGYLAKVRKNKSVAWVRNYTAEFSFVSDTFCCAGFIFEDVKPLHDGGAMAVGFTTLVDSSIQNRQLRNKGVAGIFRVDSFGCVVPGCQLAPNGLAAELPKARLLLAPNPASEVTYAHWLTEEPGEARFTLRDAQGRRIREWATQLPEATFIIPLDGLANGLYYLDVMHHGRQLEGKKLVVGR